MLAIRRVASALVHEARLIHSTPSCFAKLELEPSDAKTKEERKEKEGAPGSVPASYSGPVHLAHIHASLNNTIITVTDMKGNPHKRRSLITTGNAVNWASCGSCGFSGARRSSPYAAQEAGQAAAKIAREKGVEVVRVLMKGLGTGRVNAIKGLQAGGLAIQSISDVTPVPHNGARPKKARRL